MNVTALIADDELLARQGLRAMLGAIEWVTVIGEAASGTDAVAQINARRPELLFLDIQMPGLLGTDVLRHVSYQPFVVFTTAYAEHAVTAFELGALDYLLKPFGPVRFGAAMERVRSALGEPVAHAPLDRLSEALSQSPMSRLFVRTGGSLTPIAVADIADFESDGDYVAVHAGRVRHLLHVSLSRLEARLDPARFVRIHRTHIVNLDHVKSFRRLGRGQLVAEMHDGRRLPVSRSRAAALRALGA